jgi:EAL domain-containing protein (putative c-di-GMP-specific phosphodiesterase class I)
VTEGDRLEDGPWLAQILRKYKRCGLLTAIDDFGAGYAGLSLLADFQPDLIKIDMGLIRNADTNAARQAIVNGLMRICADLGVQVIAEGIETAGERDFLHDAGIRLMQGYLFSWPGFQGVGVIEASSWSYGSRVSPNACWLPGGGPCLSSNAAHRCLDRRSPGPTALRAAG